MMRLKYRRNSLTVGQLIGELATDVTGFPLITQRVNVNTTASPGGIDIDTMADVKSLERVQTTKELRDFIYRCMSPSSQIPLGEALEICLANVAKGPHEFPGLQGGGVWETDHYITTFIQETVLDGNTDGELERLRVGRQVSLPKRPREEMDRNSRPVKRRRTSAEMTPDVPISVSGYEPFDDLDSMES